MQLIRDRAQATRLGQNGRATVERDYAWSLRAAQFEDVLLAAHAAAHAARGDKGPRVQRIDVRHKAELTTEVENGSTGARP